jgi:hypothetical protein
VHRWLRRLAVLLLALAVPVSIIGSASATGGVLPAPPPPPPRTPHPLAAVQPPTERGDEERTESAVVLVVLDGVRWQEVVYGADRALAEKRGLNPLVWANPRDLMPNLHRFVDTRAVLLGAPGHGPSMRASGPHFISEPGYLEIFDGRPAPTCHYNDCARPPYTRSFADDVRDGGSPEDVAVIASWPNIARASSADPSRFVVSAGRSIIEHEEILREDPVTAGLVDKGSRSYAYPGEGGYRPDAITARIALRYLMTVKPRFLFVGLGDGDEWGHRDDYASYLDAVHAEDAFLGDLLATLDTMGARGRHTSVIVTADHGRAWSFRDHGIGYPESARVWLVAGGGDVTEHGVATSLKRHTLSDIAPTVRALLGVRGEETWGSEPIGEIVGRREL